MGRHAAPDRWAFWRSFAKAVGGALLALVLTAALVLLLIDMGQARNLVGLRGPRAAEQVDPASRPGPRPVVPDVPDVEADEADERLPLSPAIPTHSDTFRGPWRGLASWP